MNDRLHAGIAVLSAVFVGAVLLIRWAVTPVRDHGPAADEHPTVVTPIAQFMHEQEWEPVYGIALEQAQDAERLQPASVEATS